MRNIRVACLVVLGLFGLLPRLAEATHFRGTIVTWRNEPAAGPYGVAFTVRFSARRDGYGGSDPDGFAAIGDVVSEDIGGTNFDFGDGTPRTGVLRIKVVAIDKIDNVLTGFLQEAGTSTPGEIRHAYAGPTQVTALFTSCCRISNDNLNPDGTYTAKTIVTPGAANRCPTSNALSNVDAFQGRLLKFKIAANDPERAQLLYRYATTDESGLTTAPIPGVNLNALTGEVTWSVPGAQKLGPYSTQIIVTDGVNVVPIDFTITVRDPALGFPPSFIQPPSPCDAVIFGKVGAETAFTLQGLDTDVGQIVTLNNNGLPGTAAFQSITNPGNPAIATFRWTPDASFDLTTQIVVFTASDGLFSATPCSVTIPVGFADLKLTKSHVGNFSAGSNGTFTIKVDNIGGSPTNGQIKVTDILGRGLSFVSGGGNGWTCSASGKTVTCTNPGPINNGGSSQFNLVTAVDQTAIPATSNYAKAEVLNEYDPTNNEAYDVALVAGLDVAISKGQQGVFNTGGTGIFNLTVRNVGLVPTHSSAPVKVGSIAESRFGTGWTLDGPNMTNTRAKLQSSANFGSGGRVSRSIAITDISDPITPSLLANYEVFFVGYLNDDNAKAFTKDELSAFQNFVNNGGTLIAACEDFNYDNVCNQFGYYAQTMAPNPMRPVSTATNHPIFSGPFGTITGFNGAQTQGYIFDPSGATNLAQDSASPAHITMIERAYGAGRVIFMGDVDFIALAATSGSGISSANDMLLGNLFAYAGRTGPIKLTDSLPGALTYQSATGTAWSCSGAGQSATCFYPGPIPVGGATNVQLRVGIGAVGTVVNNAAVKAEGDANPANDTTSLSVVIYPVGQGPVSPTLSTFTPVAGPTSGGTVVTITGTGFNAGASVLFGGIPGNVTNVTSTSITVTTPAHAEGTYDLVVTNTDGGSARLDPGFTFFVVRATTGFYTVSPCRVLDTRNANGPLGGPALSANTPRTFAIAGQCGIPNDAVAISSNVTIVIPSAKGSIRLYAAGTTPPPTSSVSFEPGQTRANNAVFSVAGAPQGNVTVLPDMPVGSAVNFILDVNGYWK